MYAESHSASEGLRLCVCCTYVLLLLLCVCSVDAMSVMNETENVEVLQLVNTSTVDSVDQLNSNSVSVSSVTVPQTGKIFSTHHVCICFPVDT